MLQKGNANRYSKVLLYFVNTIKKFKVSKSEMTAPKIPFVVMSSIFKMENSCHT